MIISSHFITLDGVIGSPEVWHPSTPHKKASTCCSRS